VEFNLLAPIFGGAGSFLAGGICFYPGDASGGAVELCLDIDTADIIGFDESGNEVRESGYACTASVADDNGEMVECASCNVCSDLKSVTFDCGVGQTVTTCTDLGVFPTKLGDIRNADKAIYPEFDS